MRRSCPILTILVVGCVLFLQIGWQEQVRAAEESNSELTASEPAETETASEANEPAPEGPHFTERPQNGNPEITFEEMIHDFGKIGPGTKNTCEFKFTNTGDGLLKIKKTHAPCGCTVPELSKKEYVPGESGTLKVKYHSSRHYDGPVTKRLYVHSNDKARPKVTLTIKAEIVKKVDYEPKKLNLLLKSENAGCPEITLNSLDDRPFSIKQFKSTADCITADVDYSVKATRFVIQPKVDIGKLRKSLRGRINISLTHPECKAVTVPFEALPEFKTDPSLIIIFNAEPQKPQQKEVWILNNYNEDFEIESASSKKGIIKVLSQEKVDNRYQFKLEITPPAAEDKTKFFTDVFFVNIKGGEKLKITCRGFYSKKKSSN